MASYNPRSSDQLTAYRLQLTTINIWKIITFVPADAWEFPMSRENAKLPDAQSRVSHSRNAIARMVNTGEWPELGRVSPTVPNPKNSNGIF